MAERKPPARERNDEALTIMLTPDQMETIQRAAEADFDQVEEWARRVLVRAASERFTAGGTPVSPISKPPGG